MEEWDMFVVDCIEFGIVKMRVFFEWVLILIGLYFIEGGKVWEVYCDYELVFLFSMVEVSFEVL